MSRGMEKRIVHSILIYIGVDLNFAYEQIVLAEVALALAVSGGSSARLS